MDETDRGQAGDVPPNRAGPNRAGDVLRAAREAHGLTIADIATRTRVPQRHLEAIEASDYSGLPSPTYAVGFAKAYARAVGADEVAIAADVRADVAQTARPAPRYEPYVASDPSRVPSRGVAIAGLGVALAILILIGLWYATDWFRPAGGVAASTETTVAAPVISAPVPAPRPVAGQVTLVATDTVWLRVYDAADKTLFQGTMKPGDRFDVPADADDPMINVGRPDKLAVTLNGSAVPPLGTGERAIKDMKIGATALAARPAGTQAPIASASPTPAMSPTPVASASPTPVANRSSTPVASRTPATRTSSARGSEPTPRRTARPTSRPTSRPRPRPSPSRDAPENLLPSGFSTGTANP